MALETEERGQPSLLERPRPLAVRTRAVGDHDHTTAEPRTDSVRARGPAPRRLRAKRLLVDFLPRYEGQEAPVGAIALLLLAVATVTVTYLYY